MASCGFTFLALLAQMRWKLMLLASNSVVYWPKGQYGAQAKGRHWTAHEGSLNSVGRSRVPAQGAPVQARSKTARTVHRRAALRVVPSTTRRYFDPALEGVGRKPRRIAPRQK